MIARRMRRIPLVAVSSLALCIGGAVVIAPGWLERMGLDCWHFGDVRRSLRDAGQRTALLEAKSINLHRETEACNHIVMQLAREEITLEQAITELTPLLREREGFYSNWTIIYREPTFRHGVARYALIRVQTVLENEPERLAALVEPLEAQYYAIK